MLQKFNISLPIAALLTLSLALGAQATAEEYAVVGHVNDDGSFELYEDRFQETFADGTPVARVEVTEAGGFVRVSRWADNGCRGEATTVHAGPRGTLVVSSATVLDLYKCVDDGCQARFGELAFCGDIETLGVKCKCIRLDPDSTSIIANGDYCKRSVSALTIWDLLDWILPHYIR